MRTEYIVESLEFKPVVVSSTSKYAAKQWFRTLSGDRGITITKIRRPLWGELRRRHCMTFLIENEEQEQNGGRCLEN